MSNSSINQKLSCNYHCIRKSLLLGYSKLASVSWAFIKMKHIQIFLFPMNLIFDLDCSKSNNLSNSREAEVSRLYEDSEFGSQYRVTLWLMRDLLPCLLPDNLFNSSSKYNFSFVWIANSQHMISESKQVSRRDCEMETRSRQRLAWPVVWIFAVC